MIKTLISALTLIALAGCATIVASGPDYVPVNTRPSNARVFLNGLPVGTTPILLTLNRKDDFNLRIELDGYEPVILTRSKDLNGWVFGNILFGGIIGVVIDVATGNSSKHSKDPVYAELQSLKADGSKMSENTKIPLTRVPASVK